MAKKSSSRKNTFQDRTATHLAGIKSANQGPQEPVGNNPGGQDIGAVLPNSTPQAPTRNVTKGLPLPPNDLATVVKKTVR